MTNQSIIEPIKPDETGMFSERCLVYFDVACLMSEHETMVSIILCSFYMKFHGGRRFDDIAKC